MPELATAMTQLPFDPDLATPSQSSDPFRERRPRREPREVRRNLLSVVAVSAGGVVGGCARYGVDLLMPASARGFPWGTFTVNVSGAFLLAVLLTLVFEAWPPTRYVQAFLAIGMLGSATTFSTLIVDVNRLLLDGARAVAAAYLGATVISGLAATVAGLMIGRGVVSRRRTHLRKNA